jgi:DNA-binding transcriptional ArsR family regulator
MTDLEQLRVVADPLRLRILSVFARGAYTTKQVAGLLGEKHTKLYHHVQALERVKLIRLTETRPKRGTVEKYYQAVAARFEAAPSILFFQPRVPGKRLELEVMLNALLDAARGDVVTLAARIQTSAALMRERKDGLLAARFLVRGSASKIRGVRSGVLRVLKQFRKRGRKENVRKGAVKKDSRRMYSITILICPADRS